MDRFPHLKNQSAEFIALADTEAVVKGITIPLHSHVLAKSSRVFAQLFSALAEDADTDDDNKKRRRTTTGSRPSKNPFSVTELLAEEPLEAVLLLLLILYNPGMEFTRAIFDASKDLKKNSWGPNNAFCPDPALCPDSKITSAYLQAVVKLADKLDCVDIINRVKKYTKKWQFACICVDPLDWLTFSRQLKLHEITAYTLNLIAKAFAARPTTVKNNQIISLNTQTQAKWEVNVNDSRALLVDDMWSQLDPATFMLLTEANTIYNMKDLWSLNDDNLVITEDALENYTKPGDLFNVFFPEPAAPAAAEDAGQQPAAQQ
jgi:hypothetical protein